MNRDIEQLKSLRQFLMDNNQILATYKIVPKYIKVQIDFNNQVIREINKALLKLGQNHLTVIT